MPFPWNNTLLLPCCSFHPFYSYRLSSAPLTLFPSLKLHSQSSLFNLTLPPLQPCVSKKPPAPTQAAPEPPTPASRTSAPPQTATSSCNPTHRPRPSVTAARGSKSCSATRRRRSSSDTNSKNSRACSVTRWKRSSSSNTSKVYDSSNRQAKLPGHTPPYVPQHPRLPPNSTAKPRPRLRLSPTRANGREGVPRVGRVPGWRGFRRRGQGGGVRLRRSRLELGGGGSGRVLRGPRRRRGEEKGKWKAGGKGRFCLALSP